MNKWLKVIFVVSVLALVIVLIASFAYPRNNAAPVVNQQNPTPINYSQYSTNGTVSSINSNQYTILLSDNKTSKGFKTTSTTEVVKRSSGKLVKDSIASVKVGSQVIVYTTSDPGKTINFTAEKVEIIR